MKINNLIILVLLFTIAIVSAQSATYGLSGSAGTPTLGSCGTTPSISADSADFGGQITMGTGIVTSCALLFSGTMVKQPKCVISSNSTVATIGMTAISVNGFTIGTSISLPGGIINYLCIIN